MNNGHQKIRWELYILTLFLAFSWIFSTEWGNMKELLLAFIWIWHNIKGCIPPFLLLINFRSRVPNPQATACYLAMAYLELHCVRGWLERTDTQLNFHEWQAGRHLHMCALTCCSHKLSCAHVHQPATHARTVRECMPAHHLHGPVPLFPPSQATKLQRLGTAAVDGMGIHTRIGEFSQSKKWALMQQHFQNN